MTKILSASGSLACRKDTSPTKSLSHPAIIDWALSRYLLEKRTDLAAPFDRDLGRQILAEAEEAFPDQAHRLRMFQNVLSANHSKERANCIFGRGDAGQLLILQRYNRVFIYQDGLPKTVHLYSAAAKKLTPAMLNKRKKSGEAVIQHDQEALSVLKANGLGNLAKGREATVQKIPNLSPDWFMHVENRAVNLLQAEEQEAILHSLDYDKYLDLVASAYEKNWRNLTTSGPVL